MMKSQRGRPGAPLTVLMFHGLVERHPPYSNFSETRTCQLRVRDFSKTLESCARRYKFARLEDVPRYLNGEATEPGVLLTFDDGLASVCELAAPILLRYGATATLFVTSGWIDSGLEPAVFEFEQELWLRAPARFEVKTENFSFETHVASPAAAAPAIARLWTSLFSNRCAPLSLRHDHFFFNGRPWKESANHKYAALWQPASWDSLRSAVKSGALEIGAHGVSHTPWPWLEPDALAEELVVCKKRLQFEFNAPIETCAYPHGLSSAGTRLQTGEVFSLAFGTSGAPARPGVDRTNVPRYHVPAEFPNGLPSIISWPRVGGVLRRGTRMLAY